MSISASSDISSLDDMASFKDIPCAFEIENIKFPSPIKAKVSSKEVPPSPTLSTTIEEGRSPDYDSPPDGGLFAWLQVLGGWILVLNSR